MGRPSIPILAAAAIALAALGGAIVLAFSTAAGTAPGNGQQVFDQPGCAARSYAGPGRRPHYEATGCPLPQAVIASASERVGAGWRVTWDGSRSFDPAGVGLHDFHWSFAGIGARDGERVVVHYPRPGLYRARLQVTDDEGSVGTGYSSIEVR